MAHSILLQDWITVRGNAGSTIVLQQEDSYADLIDYKELIIYSEVADFSGSAAVQCQTSPTKDNGLFLMMGAATSGAGVQLSQVQYTATIPLARWVRWRASGTAAWTITFRTWLSAIPVRF